MAPDGVPGDVSIDGSGGLQPLVEKLIQEAELAGIGKDLRRMEIFEHAVKSVLESEERFVDVSRSRIPVLECGFHRVSEARVSLGDRS